MEESGNYLSGWPPGRSLHTPFSGIEIITITLNIELARLKSLIGSPSPKCVTLLDGAGLSMPVSLDGQVMTIGLSSIESLIECFVGFINTFFSWNGFKPFAYLMLEIYVVCDHCN